MCRNPIPYSIGQGLVIFFSCGLKLVTLPPTVSHKSLPLACPRYLFALATDPQPFCRNPRVGMKKQQGEVHRGGSMEEASGTVPLHLQPNPPVLPQVGLDLCRLWPMGCKLLTHGLCHTFKNATYMSGGLILFIFLTSLTSVIYS